MARDKAIYVTDHAYQRMRERLNLNRKASERMARMVRNKGIIREDTSGQLNRYISKNESMNLKKSSRVFCYGEFAYVFAEKKDCLITVLPIPHMLRKHCVATQRKMR